MVLIATLGFALLLPGPPTGAPAAIVFTQPQDGIPVQNPSGQTPQKSGPASAKPTGSPQQKTPPSSDPNNAKSGSSHKRKASTSTAKKPAQEKPDTTSGIVVVRNGGTSETQGQIASGTTVRQASRQLKETNSLLSSTASNLQKISGKELSPNQQDMVKQIRDYMQQSKGAARAGDVRGANNLAFKAHLLSQELVKH